MICTNDHPRFLVTYRNDLIQRFRLRMVQMLSLVVKVCKLLRGDNIITFEVSNHLRQIVVGERP